MQTFDKEVYWKQRKAAPAAKRMARHIRKQLGIVAMHYHVDWPMKPVSKKAMLKSSKRARREAPNVQQAGRPVSSFPPLQPQRFIKDLYPADMTNHRRMSFRKRQRQAVMV